MLYAGPNNQKPLWSNMNTQTKPAGSAHIYLHSMWEWVEFAFVNYGSVLLWFTALHISFFKYVYNNNCKSPVEILP